MEEWLKNLKPDAWYKVVAVTGGLALVASIPAGAAAGIFIGLGLLGIGCGEWTSRITVQRPTPAGYGVPAGILRTTTRVWRPQGIALDVGGAVLLLIGLFQLFR
jgi:hypothetical protein